VAYALALILALLLVSSEVALAHGIGGKDASFVAATKGPDILPFMYLGAKHMVTGYDHLLFILGVIFFLYRMRDVVIYVTLFSIGHSITLLSGVLLKLEVNAYLIDAVIGLSVAYKAFDNLGGFTAGTSRTSRSTMWWCTCASAGSTSWSRRARLATRRISSPMCRRIAPLRRSDAGRSQRLQRRPLQCPYNLSPLAPTPCVPTATAR